jgi:hypothetical protein
METYYSNLAELRIKFWILSQGFSLVDLRTNEDLTGKKPPTPSDCEVRKVLDNTQSNSATAIESNN